MTFAPAAITGLSGALQTGQPLTFQITGDLTIRDVTRPVIFTVTAQAVSASQITGAASAWVKAAVDEWAEAAGLSAGRVFCAIHKGGWELSKT